MLSVLHRMENASPCRICGEQTHHAEKCHELIYATPGGGGGGHDHGDDEGLVQMTGRGAPPFILPPVSGGQALPSLLK